MNATNLFDGDNNSWPVSSESFWTTLFAFFVLHLGNIGAPTNRLRVWHCTDGTNKKYYAPRIFSPTLELSNLNFDSISIEPRALSKTWPGTQLILPPEVGGFSPDILIRTQKVEGIDHFIIIENKVTSGARLAGNQLENYRYLREYLLEKNVSFEILLLQSVGGCTALYEQAIKFQEEWNNQFGILLWEEALRVMQSSNFCPQGLPIQLWQKYTGAFDSDCVQG